MEILYLLLIMTLQESPFPGILFSSVCGPKNILLPGSLCTPHSKKNPFQYRYDTNRDQTTTSPVMHQAAAILWQEWSGIMGGKALCPPIHDIRRLPYTLHGLRSYTINRLQPPTGCLQPTNAFPILLAAVCMRCPAPGRICYNPL